MAPMYCIGGGTQGEWPGLVSVPAHAPLKERRDASDALSLSCWGEGVESEQK